MNFRSVYDLTSGVETGTAACYDAAVDQHHKVNYGIRVVPYAKVIINPVAGGGRSAKLWPLISQQLKDKGLSFNHSFTEGTGHGIELAKESVDKGYELVIAVG
ncbi:MAG: acylglycerol kinase family protein [Syntrophales bacterium]